MDKKPLAYKIGFMMGHILCCIAIGFLTVFIATGLYEVFKMAMHVMTTYPAETITCMTPILFAIFITQVIDP